MPLQAIRGSSGPSLTCCCVVLPQWNLLEHPSKQLQTGSLHLTEESFTGSCRDLSDTIFLYLNEALQLVYIVINIIIIVEMAACPKCLESWTWNLFNGIIMVFVSVTDFLVLHIINNARYFLVILYSSTVCTHRKDFILRSFIISVATFSG